MILIPPRSRVPELNLETDSWIPNADASGEGRTKCHQRSPSAFYLLSGDEVELWTGDDLAHREVARPGDYLFIPAKVPHVAVNRSKTTPAVFIGARNEPTAQESVVMLPKLDAKVP